MEARTGLPIALMLCLGLILSGCAAAVVGGAAAGGAVAVQERGFGDAISDTTIRAEINGLWAQERLSYFSNLNLQVQEGRVLVSGAVTDPDQRAKAIELTRKVKGVREVYNEIDVTNEGGLGVYARDSAIVTELNSRMLFDGNIRSGNFSVEAVNGTVYLLGVARTQDELDRVLTIARNIRGVRRVVNHVILKDDPRRRPA